VQVRKTPAADALVGIWGVALTGFVVAFLYLARDLLIPLALAGLLSFLLSPIVWRIERWIGRVAAVLIVVLFLFATAGAASWILTRQLVDLAAKLPDYQENIEAKIHAFKVPGGSRFKRFSRAVEEIQKQLPGATAPTPAKAGPDATAVPPSPSTAQPLPVKLVGPFGTSPVELAERIVQPLLGPLGTAALVLLLLIFMLLKREDLRGRFIRLVGQGRISATTSAMDDAGRRVSHYLLTQLIVNVSYGAVVAAGLSLIGVPNSLLWGVFAAVLRFIPYIGPWIGAAIPIALSLAVSKSWTSPLLTAGLYFVLEMIVGNFIEPWLYGSSTGVSSLSLIIAALFWTWLWGPLGLVLSTPLTVCLAVMGRHVPRLEFLSVLLSEEQALQPHEECYHRILAVGPNEANDVVNVYLKANSLTALYDGVLIPVITAAEADYTRDSLNEDQRASVLQSVRDIVEDLGTRPPPDSRLEADNAPADTAFPLAPPCCVLCLPARAERDELAGAMLAHILRDQGFDAKNVPATFPGNDIAPLLDKSGIDAVCISVVAPSTIIQARHLSLKVREHSPALKILVGLWGATENVAAAAQRLRASGADEVVVSFAEAVVQLVKLSAPLGEEMTAAPMPANEAERLAELNRWNLLDGRSDAALDRQTARLARILEVPIALVTLIDGENQWFKSQVGLPEDIARQGHVARSLSVCGHVIAADEMLVIDDMRRDRRFANNPFVKEKNLRFYAGVPLRSENGRSLGSLCVLDTKPRKMSEREKRLLQETAEDVMEHFRSSQKIVAAVG